MRAIRAPREALGTRGVPAASAAVGEAAGAAGACCTAGAGAGARVAVGGGAAGGGATGRLGAWAVPLKSPSAVQGLTNPLGVQVPVTAGFRAGSTTTSIFMSL